MSSGLHPLGYESKIAKLSSGHHLRYVDIHPPQGTEIIVTALLIHGFPDSAYGWRNQIKGWSQRGIRLIVPDTIGYAGSSQPTDPQEYSMKSQSDDFEELVRQAGVPQNERIILIAHDWQGRNHGFTNGSIQAKPREGGRQAEKFINALYSSPAKFASGEIPRFEKAGVLEGWLQDQSQTTESDILSKEELNTIVSEIKAGVGFSAMLNYYRTNQINYELEKNLPQEFRPDMPKLLVLPTADPALPAEILAQAGQGIKGVELAWLEGAGHWVMLERPQELEKLVGEWVEKMVTQGWNL
ncbi:unnamed protein product [Rhizoctonia solani]|uniref:AB hydrolase-1 domain-containing protein n=1 Tax=Rhizoctonia solani TaxID=456999 RepID=A0A8H2Y6Q9_9AGAM|nr:unnamed protein product [Rhizoctonia solani]